MRKSSSGPARRLRRSTHGGGALRPPWQWHQEEWAGEYLASPASLFEFVDWVCDEYQSKGFVEVTEEYLAERAEVDAWAAAEWGRIMAKLADSDDEDDDNGDDLDTTIEN